MLNATYFREHFYEQAKALGTPTVELRLRSGVVFRVKTVEHVDDNYVLLTVCPHEIEDADKAEIDQAMKCRMRPGSDTVFFDRVAIPYEEMAYLLMSIAESELSAPFGFRLSK